ncbi:flagellar hook-associated protein FlgL [Bacillus massilinigeriensis]|uniref:flagellar hook-associated protein FlgL n=1 Tax=Bacillus massilionigeriensis TaxID=1805475 RepID=UPI00096B5652|nr:flagellar hook-associated protein FlgL [Bacillus massilionigeriensis]
MRVTQSMLSNNMLRNLSKNYEKMSRLQDQVSSNRKFNKPSDDPVAAMRAMGYRTELNRIEQYSQNIGEVQNWLDSTDDAIGLGVDALQRIRELTVNASNGTMTVDERKAVAAEVEQLKQQLINIGDTQVGGKYIFNGTKTNASPSTDAAGNPLNPPVYDTGIISIEVFSGIKLPVNTSGKGLFEDGSGNNLFQDLDTFIDDLKNDNQTGINSFLGKIDSHTDRFLAEQANVGARQNRLELMEDRISTQEVFTTDQLSKNEDIDFAEVMTEFTTAESVYRAALGIGSKVIQPTLMDFLR